MKHTHTPDTTRFLLVCRAELLVYRGQLDASDLPLDGLTQLGNGWRFAVTLKSAFHLSPVTCLWGDVRLGVWGVVLVVCVSVSMSGLLFSVGVCVCVTC